MTKSTFTTDNGETRENVPPDSVSVNVVQRVATTTDRETTELPPLYDTLDPEALDALVDSLTVSASVEFVYSGCRVTVDAAGNISVDPRSRCRENAAPD